jgi:hypothetical protein
MLRVNDKKLEDDIELLKQNKLTDCIPKYVHDYFKITYNEKILRNLLESLNLIIVDNKGPNGSLYNVAIRLSDAFNDYYSNLAYIIAFIERYKKFSAIIQFRNHDDIHRYQSAILMQNFEIHHFDLLHLIFQKVFDIYSMSTDGKILLIDLRQT